MTTGEVTRSIATDWNAHRTELVQVAPDRGVRVVGAEHDMNTEAPSRSIACGEPSMGSAPLYMTPSRSQISPSTP